MRKFFLTNKYVHRKIVDESILVPISPALPERNSLFVLNPTGQAIFAGIQAGKEIDQIEMELREIFTDVPDAELQDEVNEFIAELQRIEAIDVQSTN